MSEKHYGGETLQQWVLRVVAQNPKDSMDSELALKACAERITELESLLATGGQAQADKEMQLAMQEASNLAQSIFMRHYSDDEHYANGSVVWELCGDLRGVLSQISNMVSGLMRTPQSQADARDARKSGCAESNRYCHARMCLDGDAEHEHDCPAGRAAIAAAKGE